MSKKPSGSPRAGTHGQALTRRQRKRARHQHATDARHLIVSSTTPAHQPMRAVAQSSHTPATALAVTSVGDPNAETESGATSTSPLRAEVGIESAEAEIESAEAEIESAEAEIESAEAEAESAEAETESAPRPVPATSSHRHPTLAIMADIAARASTGSLPAASGAAWAPIASPEAMTPPNRAGTAHEAATPVTPRRVPSIETTPIRAVRSPKGTSQPNAAVPVEEAPNPAPSASASGHRRFPEPDLVPAVASSHAALAAVAALGGAVLALQGNSLAVALLALAALAGSGGGLAYALDQQRGTRVVGGIVLVCAQVGMMAWLLALLGPRTALLSLVPALAVLAGRIAGRGAATAQVAAMLLVYIGALTLALSGHFSALLAITGSGATALDATVAVVGVLAALAALNALAREHEQARAAARARAYEARTLRATLARERAQTEQDAEALRAALASALRKRAGAPVAAHGALNLLAMTVNRAAERLGMLHQDRDERLRLEGALRQLTRGMERSWLGLPWT
ncbi:MAG: hypothetical protein IVW57_11070, partial [Ktedonobacterales bacterium]|nr:hypothetical protein [Ktedonobacterales bacterium]